MKKNAYRSILMRYIISYAAVMAVLYIGVGIYVSNSYASAIHASIVEDNTNRLSSLRMQHEEKLTTLMSVANQLSLSPYVIPFRLETNTMKAYHLKQNLASYNSDDGFFDNLYIIFHDDKYLYSASTTASIELFTRDLIHYENISPGELEALLRQKNDTVTILPTLNVQSVLLSDTNKKKVTVIIPLRLDGRFIIGNVIFFVNESSYQRLFADEISLPRNMYIFNGQEFIAANRRIDIPDEIILNAISGAEGSFTKDLQTQDGSKYLLFVQRGSVLDLDYVSLIPHETVQMQTARSRLGFALFMLMLSIPCTVLTVFFARRHVKPIQELGRSIGVTSPTGDGFTAIRTGIEKLIGQNRDLHTRLDESKAAFKASFVRNFVKNRYSTREETISAATELELDIDHTYYCVALTSTVLQDAHGLDKLIKLTELNGESDVKGYGTDILNQEQYLFILFSDRREALVSWAESAKSLIASLDREGVISVSNIHVDFSEATSAYLEASTAYDNRFVMGNEYVLWFSDVSVTARDTEPFSRGYLEGFRRALHAGDARALNDRINELFQILRDKKFSLFAFRMIYNDLISMLLNKYLSYGGVSPDTLQYYDIFELSRIRQVEDLIETLRQLCTDILHKEEQTAEQGSSVIRQVIEYLRGNYTCPDLSMGAVAEKYGISPSRLSLEYKEITGMYPSDYLLLLRMEKAKQLLAETDMPIQDVGTAVGYYDASGFIRRFKKHMSMTPAQYRTSVRSHTSTEPSIGVIEKE